MSQCVTPCQRTDDEVPLCDTLSKRVSVNISSLALRDRASVHVTTLALGDHIPVDCNSLALSHRVSVHITSLTLSGLIKVYNFLGQQEDGKVWVLSRELHIDESCNKFDGNILPFTRLPIGSPCIEISTGKSIIRLDRKSTTSLQDAGTALLVGRHVLRRSPSMSW